MKRGLRTGGGSSKGKENRVWQNVEVRAWATKGNLQGHPKGRNGIIVDGQRNKEMSNYGVWGS